MMIEFSDSIDFYRNCIQTKLDPFLCINSSPFVNNLNKDANTNWSIAMCICVLYIEKRKLSQINVVDNQCIQSNTNRNWNIIIVILNVTFS